jgi:hypothetical protein
MSRVILDNNAIESLFYNNALLEAFPFLKEAADRKKARERRKEGCAVCANKIVEEYNNIKAAIAHMTETRRNDFKTITGYSEVKIIYRAGKTNHTVMF